MPAPTQNSASLALPSMAERSPAQAPTRLLSTAVISIAVRGLGPLSALLLTLLLARMLGAAQTGAFYLLTIVMTFASIVAKLGFDNALQRFVGPAFAGNDWAKIRGLYIQSLRITATIAIGMALLLLALSVPITEMLLDHHSQWPLVIWMGLTVVPFTLIGVHAAMLKAVGRPVWGGFIEAAALPMATIILVILNFAAADHLPPSINTIAFAFFAGACSAALLGGWLLLSRLPETAGHPGMDKPQLMASCLPLTLVELLNYAILWLPMLLLGALADTTAAGQYNIAQRLAGQLGLLMLVFAAITASRFAAHHHANEPEKVLQLAVNATRGMSLLGVPAALLLLLWPEQWLGIFGAEFTDAALVLQILTAAQLVNLMTGPVGYLLAMTGHEQLLRNLLIITSGMTLVCALLWVPEHGAVGAAWAVALPLVLQNLAACLLLNQRLGLPFLLIFGPLSNRSRT